MPLTPERLVLYLGLLLLAILAAGAAIIVLRAGLPYPYPTGPAFFIRLFDLDAERNLPTWFSSNLLLINAALLGLCGATYTTGRLSWWSLAAIFLLLSLDESASIHEAAGRFASRSLGIGGGQTQFWVVLALPVIALLGAVYWRFLTRLPARTRRLSILAGAVYISGAVGVEAIGWLQSNTTEASPTVYSWLAFLEEATEMTGQLIFTFTLLDALRRSGVSIRFGPPRDTGSAP
ncbi:hypothetical protein [Litorisediminicola beolgyonensis]|uniref:DUF998 domain-containing protein n=1 Tax=Litorisediminicola beolgyonensis TaxID=1173614 RepID=A0ABW3ZCT2_9RHOB